MKTNFFRSTVLLVMILIIPLLDAGWKTLHKYNFDKSRWPYILIAVIVGVLIFGLLIGLSLLFYSFFLARNGQRKNKTEN